MTIAHFTVPATPDDEARRLAVLELYPYQSHKNDTVLAGIVARTAELFAAPMVLVSIVAAEQQCFPACVGLDVVSTPRSISFCGHAILDSGSLVVGDAQRDARFAGNPLVIGAPHIRFYAGTPLVAPEGVAIGTLCVIDTVPRETIDVALLERQAAAVMDRLNELRGAGMVAGESTAERNAAC